MNKSRFGDLLQQYRKQRGLTQADLADKASQYSQAPITAKQIGRIERGEVIKTERFLEPLSRALELSEFEKKSFFSSAGRIYETKPQEDNENLTNLLIDTQYPALASTMLWDLIAVNTYHKALWGDNQNTIHRLRTNPLGPNLLVHIFDPFYRETRPQFLGDNALHWVVWAFRASSAGHEHEKRYREIVNYMLSEYEEFKEYWKATVYTPHGMSKFYAYRPYVQLNHRKFGKLEFMSLRLPKRYTEDNLRTSIYVPLPNSEANYQNLRESVIANHIELFPRIS